MNLSNGALTACAHSRIEWLHLRAWGTSRFETTSSLIVVSSLLRPHDEYPASLRLFIYAIPRASASAFSLIVYKCHGNVKYVARTLSRHGKLQHRILLRTFLHYTLFRSYVSSRSISSVVSHSVAPGCMVASAPKFITILRLIGTVLR